MTTSIAIQRSGLLKRKQDSWPNSGESSGILCRKIGAICFWEAVGPARELFIQISKEIKSRLEKISDPISHTVTWTIYMVGRAKELALPTIMFCCKVPGPRKRARRMIEESGIIDKYPGIVTGDSSRPPDFDQLVQLAFPEGPERLGTGITNTGKSVFYNPSGKVCGGQIYVKDKNHAEQLLRKATIGGILLAGDRFFCLTVAHAFIDDVQVLSSDLTEDSNFEFDVDGQSDVGGGEVDIVKIIGQGRQTRETAATPSSQRIMTTTSADGLCKMQHLPGRSTSRDFTHSFAQTVGLLSDDLAAAAKTFNLGDLREVGSSILSSINGPYPGLDYALIEINKPQHKLFNQVDRLRPSTSPFLYPERIVTTRPDPNTLIIAATASSGTIRGSISGTPTFLRHPESNTFQEVWTVRLDGKLWNGDCGSWVLDPNSGDVYGHIIAGSPDSGVAYVVPAKQVHADIQARFSPKIMLATRGCYPACMPHTGSPQRDSVLHTSASESSMRSPSLGSYHYAHSPCESYDDSDESYTHRRSLYEHRGSAYEQSTASLWSPRSQELQLFSIGKDLSLGIENELPPFNIEKDGNPSIHWLMYYDFVVTNTEAYYQLRPGFIPTDNYPTRRACEKLIIEGKRFHPCGVPNCNARPFTRYYDLERHFSTVHIGKGVKTQLIHCDYARCPHKDPFRKDHGREHYREYHSEDLIKRGTIKESKIDDSQKKSSDRWKMAGAWKGSQTLEEFLESRSNIDLRWWRCSKCVSRVKVHIDGYKCPRCNLPCEAPRKAWRERLAERSARRESSIAYADASQAGDSTSNSGLPPSSPASGCRQCQNSWLFSESDITGELWAPCPRCQP